MLQDACQHVVCAYTFFAYKDNQYVYQIGLGYEIKLMVSVKIFSLRTNLFQKSLCLYRLQDVCAHTS